MIRFSGHLTLRGTARPDGRTALAAQSFRAPFHLSKPYWDADSRTLLVQVVNPTAGILSGDRLESDIAADPGAALLVTTPSASRVFMMREGLAECAQRFRVARGGWLEVSPEPLVPHRGSRYHQSTTVDVEPGGALLFLDQLMPGRIGSGESWSWAELVLDLHVRLGGDLILRERFASTGPELRDLAHFAGSGPTACFANILLLLDDSAARWRDDLAALSGGGVWLGVSALRRGGWTVKLVAPNPIALRDTLRALRQILARSVPRLTFCARKL